MIVVDVYVLLAIFRGQHFQWLLSAAMECLNGFCYDGVVVLFCFQVFKGMVEFSRAGLKCEVRMEKRICIFNVFAGFKKKNKQVNLNGQNNWRIVCTDNLSSIEICSYLILKPVFRYERLWLLDLVADWEFS